MPIYIVKWTEGSDAKIPKHYADNSYTRAKVVFNEKRKLTVSSDPEKITEIGDEQDALTKHNPVGQAGVIELINSLN